MRRILCLYAPYLSTERVQRDYAPAGDRQRPLVLTRPVGASLVVEQTCPRARQRGLRAGMSLGQAQALVPDLVAWPHDAQRDQRTLRRLARWALRFSPIVEPVDPHTLLLDITGCERLFRGEQNLVQQAVRGLAEQGFRARAAIADTVGAAWALALAGTGPVCIAPPAQTTAFLAPLSPATLRIDAQTVTDLDTLGVRTIGDLLMLPRAALPARFGPQLVLRLQQALGEVYEGVAPHRPTEPPCTSLSFQAPLTEFLRISATAERLLSELCQQVVRRGVALRQLDCVLYYERTPPRVVTIHLAGPARRPAHLWSLLRPRLEQVDCASGIVGLALVARRTSPWHGVQGELFEPPPAGAEEALTSLIDRLAARLGHEVLVRPRALDDYQPERAYRYVPVAEAGCLAEPSPSPGPDEGLRPRPARLLPHPILIRVIALVPDGPPTWLFYGGRERLLVHSAGPERLETAWWRGADLRRDYFRVTTEDGVQLWIFHALNEGRWYLHGVFS